MVSSAQSLSVGWRRRGAGRGDSQALRVATKAGRYSSRETNLRLVLQLLLHSSGHSRADLVRATGLTPATISDLVAELMESGLVEERGRGPVKVGKPAVLLGVAASARSVVAVDLSDGATLKGAVYDLGGTALARSHRPIGDPSFPAVLDLVSELIDLAPAPVLGIGVGTPGVVDPDGVVIEADNMGWLDFDLAGEIRDRFGCPVTVRNDINAAVLAEFAGGDHGADNDHADHGADNDHADHGADNDHADHGGDDHADHRTENLMVVGIGGGVGAGLIVDGHAHVGDHFAAGEIGHVKVLDDGEPCSCGNRGCLETLIAVPRLRAQLAAGDDPTEVRRRAGRHLGRVLAPVVAALDLSDVVVAGSDDIVDSVLRDATQTELAGRLLARFGGAARVRGPSAGSDVVLVGAAVAVVSQELGVA